MASFQDSLKRTWNVNVTVRTVRDIKKLVRDKAGEHVDLMDLVFDNLAFELLSNVHMLSDILWVCCSTQAQNQGIKQDDFYTGLLGETLAAAETALLEAIADFFPETQRTPYQTMIERVRTLHEATWKNTARQMEKNTEDIENRTPTTIPDMTPNSTTNSTAPPPAETSGG